MSAEVSQPTAALLLSSPAITASLCIEPWLCQQVLMTNDCMPLLLAMIICLHSTTPDALHDLSSSSCNQKKALPEGDKGKALIVEGLGVKQQSLQP